MSKKLSWLEAASREPWVILEDALLSILRLALTGQDEKTEITEIQARREPAANRAGSIVVLPIRGIITSRGQYPGDTSAMAITKAVTEAANDDDVSAIILDVDSPGGSVTGTPEAGEAIARARDKKPVVAVVTGIAASGAYWLASQASEIVLTRSGQVGSIGVFLMHKDWSKFSDMVGVKTSFIHSGKYKVEGNAYGPLGKEARAEYQAISDAFYGQFVDAVAAGRRVSRDVVLETFGQGRMKLAGPAKDVGMVDRIGSLNDVMIQLLRAAQRDSGTLSAVGTPRELETLLRDSGRVSGSEAKRIASMAYRDKEAAPRDEEEDSTATIQALDGLRKAFRAETNKE